MTSRRKEVLKKVCLLGAGLMVFSLLVTVPVLSQKKVTLEAWDWLDPAGNDPRQIARANTWEAFQKEYPEVNFELSVVPSRIINSNLIQAAAVGDSPDVSFVFNVYQTLHVDAGSIAPMDEYADVIGSDDWLISWEEDGFYNGHKYFVPWDKRATVLYYRADLFQEAGLTVPKTWKEACEAAAKLTTPDRSGFVVGLSKAELGDVLGVWFKPVIWAAGGELFDEEGNALFNSDAGARAFQVIYDLIYKYKAMSKIVLGYDYDGVTDAMKSGTAAMMMLGCHRLATIRAAGLGDKVQTAPVPGFEGGLIPAPADFTGWSLGLGGNPKNPERTEVAVKFLEFIKRPTSELYMAQGGELPARASTYLQPRLAEVMPDIATRLEWKSYLEKYGRTLKYPPEWIQFQEYLCDEANRMVLQHISAREAVDAAAKRYKQFRAEKE